MCKYHTSLLGGEIVTQRRNEWPRVKDSEPWAPILMWVALREARGLERVDRVLRAGWHKHIHLWDLGGPVATILGNGWFLPSSSFPEQPYFQGRSRGFDLGRRRMHLPSWYPKALGAKRG